MRAGVRLGVDVGSVRVGLAASDPDGVLATPVATLARDDRASSDLMAIADEARQRQALEVLVGLPRSLNGREGAAAGAARGYAARLAAHLADRGLRLEVRMVDERLSTVAAQRALRDSGVAGRRQRARVDQVAAVHLLQTALDAERATGRPPGEVVQWAHTGGTDTTGRQEGSRKGTEEHPG